MILYTIGGKSADDSTSNEIRQPFIFESIAMFEESKAISHPVFIET